MAAAAGVCVATRNGRAMLTAAPPFIDTTQPVRALGRAPDLDGRELAVAPDEIHSFPGPNGTGKTTSLPILLALIRPTSSTTRAFGLAPWLVRRGF